MALTQIKPFTVEHWFDTYETSAKYNIAETCAASISIADLQALSENKSANPLNLSTKLVYGAIRGSERLRGNLARLYSAKTASPLPADNILITNGAIAANFVLLYALVGKGDHVICQYPTYQQLYSVPESLGAEVTLWKADEDKNWQLDVDALKGMVRPETKMIIINNPNNPTGSVLGRSKLEEIVEIAKDNGLIILSDEVYRPLFHAISPIDPEFPPSILSLGYEKTIATGSLSKAYAMAGIRVGWIASRSADIIEACALAREYTTISVSQLDDQIASFALDPDCVHALLGRNIQLAKTNCAILEAFVEKHRWACDWVRPVAGTTAFVRFSRQGKPIDDVKFCQELQQKTGVFFAPGCHCFGADEDFKGYIRIGYVCETGVLEKGLAEVVKFMRTDYANVAVVE